MRHFNSALLAKQAWRLIRYPSSLVARVLKAKYFPNSSFLEATMSSNASYTWRSILKAREVLVKGVRRSLGNGATINIWHDPWVPSLPEFKVASSRMNDEEGPCVVRDLWLEKEWNMELLYNNFSSLEAEAISNIPIPLCERSDSWLWHYSKDGDYMVRSAYNLLLMNQHNAKATTFSSQFNFDWKSWCQIEALPKIKLFGWGALKDGIAVRKNLIQRGMHVDPLCPICDLEEESVLHIMVKCHDAKMMWYLSPLRMEVDNYAGDSFGKWCLSFRKHNKVNEWWSLALNFMWGIWMRRNKWVFEGSKMPIMTFIHKAVSLVGELDKAQQAAAILPNTSMQLASKWCNPELGVIKVNSDAEIFENYSAGLGAVMRDNAGDVVASTCLPIKGKFDADIAEALAMRHGLSIALESGFTRLCLETDCLKLHSHLCRKQTTVTTFGTIVNDILQLSNSCVSCSFSFVKRTGNAVAHALAKLSSSFDFLQVWMEEVPSTFVGLVEAAFNNENYFVKK